MLRKVGGFAYELALPPNFPSVYPVFHISILRKYVRDLSHVLQHQVVPLSSDLTFKIQLRWIVDRQVQRLRNKEVTSVKVVWEHHPPEEATWELETDMRV